MQVPFTDLANLLYLPPIFQLFLCEGTAVAHLTIDNPFFQVAFSIFSGDKLFFFSSAVPGGVCQEFCVNFLEIFVVFFHQRAKPFINEQLVSDYRPIG